MRAFLDSYGSWALITGASSGIGAEFARQLARLGMNLILVARREHKLYEIMESVTMENQIQVKVVAADLSQPDFLPAILSVTDSLDIGLVVNCAGFSNTGEFVDNDIHKELEMLHVNCRAPLLLSHAFGKQMLLRKRGGIVFVSSSVAFGPVPYWANYAATKAYTLFLGESLSFEWKHAGVDVLTVCPGGTKTEFQEVAGIRDTGAMSAGSVVASALRQLGKASLVIPGWHNRFLYAGIGKLLPRRLKMRLFANAIRKLLTNGGHF